MARPKETDKEIRALADRLMQELDAPRHRQRPVNSITASEYAAIAGCQVRQASNYLARRFNAGEAERVKIGNAYYYTFK